MASRALPRRSTSETPRSRAFRSHRALSTAEIAVAAIPGPADVPDGADERRPDRGDVERVPSQNDRGEVVRDQPGCRRVGVGVAEAANAAGLRLDDHDGRSIPGDRAIRLGSVRRDRVGTDPQPIDRRTRVDRGGPRRRAWPSPGPRVSSPIGAVRRRRCPSPRPGSGRRRVGTVSIAIGVAAAGSRGESGEDAGGSRRDHGR